jgi:hypothetical protein
MEGPFEELSSSLDPSKLELWTKDAEKADNERGEALDVYNLQMDKGCPFFLYQSTPADHSPISFIAPTLAEMRLNLLDAKMPTSGIQGSVTWLIEGISIEDAQ